MLTLGDNKKLTSQSHFESYLVLSNLDWKYNYLFPRIITTDIKYPTFKYEIVNSMLWLVDFLKYRRRKKVYFELIVFRELRITVIGSSQ